METLIELLNEYSKKKHNLDMRELNGELGQGFHYLNYGSSYSELLMISKKYEFIKWLVENDKINLEEVEKINQTGNVYISFGGDYEKVLMLLSISDIPIDDLISYLK